jgi:hypothetical protein
MISPKGRLTSFDEETMELHWKTCPQAIEFRTPRLGKTPGKTRQVKRTSPAKKQHKETRTDKRR